MGELLLEIRDIKKKFDGVDVLEGCLLYTSPSPRD